MNTSEMLTSRWANALSTKNALNYLMEDMKDLIDVCSKYDDNPDYDEDITLLIEQLEVLRAARNVADVIESEAQLIMEFNSERD